MRAAIYARYSSENQRETSIEDQVRQCRDWIEKQGHSVINVYSDHAISGASILRPGYQKMREDARNGVFDLLMAEALDRLSRDQEDIAGLYKQLSFAGVQIVTLSEGEINELHVGLKGTMNALFLKDLAQKTRRGLEGRVRKGKSGGGRCYGYDAVQGIDASGTPVRGERRINRSQAEIVGRIFKDFANGISPRKIAKSLNMEGIPGPRNSTWGASTIYGNWRRGTGILNNELYVGRLVWNRQTFIKDPITGKRQARLNPESEWIEQNVPHLRIIDEKLWERVKQRQQNTRSQILTDNAQVRSERARRPRYLLSGLLKCGSCGGGFSKIGRHHYGCSTARNKGTCDNYLKIRRDTVETTVLEGLKENLMHPECVQEFVSEYHRELNHLAAVRDIELNHLRLELDKVKRDIRRLIEAIKDGIPGSAVKDEMQSLENMRQELVNRIGIAPKPLPRIHPNLTKLYREKVADLASTLNTEYSRAEAISALRALIEEIRLVPEKGSLKIELYGELSALFNLANNSYNSSKLGEQITLVAGARCHLYRTKIKI